MGQQEFGPLLQGMVDARQEGISAAENEAELATGSGADYLIITHDSFSPSVLPLAKWKHAKGYRTRVVRLSEISATPTSTNITTYIKNAYNTWSPAPTYVLLVGDSQYLPAWYKTYHSYTGAPIA